MTNSNILSDEQLADYQENGFLVVRNVLSPDETVPLRRIVEEQAECNAYAPSLKYPAPGKYTVSGNTISAHTGLAPIAEHPTIVDCVESLLGERAHLTAFVAYMRTPGDKGSDPHNDYKRWRPVGSSMNWLFAIVPLTDFDAEHGPLLVSPKSHELHQVIDPNAKILDVTPPDKSQLPEFVDPELKAGDLLLLNMYTWHWAPGGTGGKYRSGIFNKYCAVNAPPAAGHYRYNQTAHCSLSDAGKRLIALHSDALLMTTRLLVERVSPQESAFLLLYDHETQAWQLPGGESWEEDDLIGWDVGSRIASMQTLTQQQLGVGIPWMSYITDFEQQDGLCRVYGYLDENGSFDAPTKGNTRCGWFTGEDAQDMLGENNQIGNVIHTWQREDIVRGKGVAFGQKERQFV
jgi:ectoine hydroxylase-related dioxygenase (phytanoyl-CoA dioxygenase family)